MAKPDATPHELMKILVWLRDQPRLGRNPFFDDARAYYEGHFKYRSWDWFVNSMFYLVDKGY